MRVLAVILLLVPVHLEAADWHWRPHIAAGGDGRTYETAWKNTRYIAWSQIKPGDRLCLHGKNDIYPDSYQPLHVQQDRVTVSGKCGEEQGVFEPGTPAQPAGTGPIFTVRGYDDVVVEDLIFRYTTRAIETEDTTNVTLQRLRIEVSEGKAIWIGGSSVGTKVLNNYILDAEDAIYFITSKNSGDQHVGCEVAGNYGENLWGKDGHMVGFQGGSTACHIHHNVAVKTGQAYVLYLWNDGKVRMERNVLEHNSAQNSPRCFSIGGDNDTPVDAINDNIIRFNRCMDAREGIYVKSQYQSPEKWAVRVKGNEFVNVLTPMKWNNPKYGSSPGTRYGVLVE